MRELLKIRCNTPAEFKKIKAVLLVLGFEWNDTNKIYLYIVIAPKFKAFWGNTAHTNEPETIHY